MKSIATILVLLASCVLSAQEVYFPKGTLGQHPGMACSYELKVLNEPSLLEMAKNRTLQAYRFVWMRTFDAPIVVRLDVKPDDTGVLTTKVGEGSAGYLHTVTGISSESSRSLSQEQTREFLSLVKRVGFWSIPTRSKEDKAGPDGSHWIIEGAKDGNYHVVDRWSPCSSSSPPKRAVKQLGTALAIDLSGLEIPKDELY